MGSNSNSVAAVPPRPRGSRAVLIALGSNLGDSVALVRHAMDRLQTLAPDPMRRSSLWHSTPVGCPPGSPPFVNAAVAFDPPSALTPEALLQRLQALEHECGRRPKTVLNEPRPLDLDLIAFGQEQRSTETLVLPHPRAQLRRFVLAPLAEVAPGFVFPGETRAVEDLLSDLVTDEVVVRWADARASANGPSAWGSEPGESRARRNDADADRETGSDGRGEPGNHLPDATARHRWP